MMNEDGEPVKRCPRCGMREATKVHTSMNGRIYHWRCLRCRHEFGKTEEVPGIGEDDW